MRVTVCLLSEPNGGPDPQPGSGLGRGHGRRCAQSHHLIRRRRPGISSTCPTREPARLKTACDTRVTSEVADNDSARPPRFTPARLAIESIRSRSCVRGGGGRRALVNADERTRMNSRRSELPNGANNQIHLRTGYEAQPPQMKLSDACVRMSAGRSSLNPRSSAWITRPGSFRRSLSGRSRRPERFQVGMSL